MEKSSPEQIMKNAKTILTIDDDYMVLRILDKMLARLGYSVIGAHGGSAGVEIYKENKDEIDLVLLDMVMPDKDGVEVYKSMKEINPNVKVLLMSGWSVDIQTKALLALGCYIIEKPFEIQELSQNIREIMDHG